MANDDTRRLGDAIAAAKTRASWEEIQANMDRLSRHFANSLPDNVSFVLVLAKKGEPDANMFASDLSTPEAIAKLARVRDQLRTGAIKTEWSKDQDVVESRIVRVN